jgi:hypothetical protein
MLVHNYNYKSEKYLTNDTNNEIHSMIFVSRSAFVKTEVFV